MLRIYWLTLAALLAVTLLALWRLHAVRQLHHAYWGAMLALYTMLPHWLQLALALVIVADDAVQHTWQALQNPAYRSPLHRLYAWLVARGVR